MDCYWLGIPIPTSKHMVSLAHSGIRFRPNAYMYLCQLSCVDTPSIQYIVLYHCAAAIILYNFFIAIAFSQSIWCTLLHTLQSDFWLIIPSQKGGRSKFAALEYQVVFQERASDAHLTLWGRDYSLAHEQSLGLNPWCPCNCTCRSMLYIYIQHKYVCFASACLPHHPEW